MDNLTTGELKTLIELVDKKREDMRPATYEDKSIYNRYWDLSFISIKLNTIMGCLENEKRVL